MKENVLRGVALLDEKVPDWRERIDKSRLSMRNMNRCILGQIFGHFIVGERKLNISPRNYGFMSDTDTDYSYRKLNQLWREQL